MGSFNSCHMNKALFGEKQKVHTNGLQKNVGCKISSGTNAV